MAERRPPIEQPPPEQRIYGNRTLNLRSIRAIGYDMDYTLVHYRVEEWERHAFEQTKGRLADLGWPVDRLAFNPDRVIRGLTIDLEEGNLVKPTRFGYVIRAAHGTAFLDFDTLRRTYHGTFVDLAEDRFVFLNTLFSLSETSLYAQLVDLYDGGSLPGVRGYADLYHRVRATLDAAHMEGDLKAQITADPDRFVVRDPDVPLTLLDQLHAGKRLLLITNAEWAYARQIMEYAFDPYLPQGTEWRDLFEMVIVSASKPGFFSGANPLFRIVDEDRSLLEPHLGRPEKGAVYFGGCAADLEEHLGLSGDQILYVGDHLFADVPVSKAMLRWRTALVIRELETEVEALEAFRPSEARLQAMMADKEAMEQRLAALRLTSQRTRLGYGPPGPDGDPEAEIEGLKSQLAALDEEIAPLARAAGEIRNEAWGPLMRSGNDKSLFARQVERYADVYTSRVSNFLHATPFAFLRAARGSLPHDPD
jgi:HAD superfamily 5'-nucleotidase-like hydrolase